MTYSCKYKRNPVFPYKHSNEKHNVHTQHTQTSKGKNKEPSNCESSFFNSLLSPVENILGRKIEFDDILLVILIYVIFTEKDKDNHTLLICLLFILLN